MFGLIREFGNQLIVVEHFSGETHYCKINAKGYLTPVALPEHASF